MYRGFYVWAIGTTVVLGFFLTFVLFGWPGSTNNCVFNGWDIIPPDSILAPPPPPVTKAQQDAYDAILVKVAATNSCYCEQFDVADTYRGAAGSRQKVNTWFNLYSIPTSLVVALWVYYARRDKAKNLIGSPGWIPDLYIFAVMFLGLGSMWFHASLKEWPGVFDTLSMYVFVSFLIFYTIHRIWPNDLFFWIAYAVTVIAVTVIGELLSLAHPHSTISLFLIVALVAVYCGFEFVIWGGDGDRTRTLWWLRNWWQHFWFGGSNVKWRWWAAVGSILVAAFFQIKSQTGEFLCKIPDGPKSFFQPHGLLWHPLAGAMAVFLYFYWRYDTVE
jgi:hypothetical protein